MASKFYSSVAKELKLKVRKFWGLIPTLGEVTGEKLVGKAFLPLYLSWIGLKISQNLLGKHLYRRYLYLLLIVLVIRKETQAQVFSF